MKYSEVQKIAKETIEYIKTKIVTGMNLLDIRKLCEEKMLESGADSFWYWDIGAFVFSGDETTISVSGREYTTSDRIIAPDDIITIDLSPQNNNLWGDYARTIIIENGKVADDINSIGNDEWRNGLLMEEELHKELLNFAAPDTTFEELYFHTGCPDYTSCRIPWQVPPFPASCAAVRVQYTSPVPCACIPVKPVSIPGFPRRSKCPGPQCRSRRSCRSFRPPPRSRVPGHRPAAVRRHAVHRH